MKVWHLCPVVSAPMPFQMALDEILFRQMEGQMASSSGNGQRPHADHEPLLRFYYSSEPWATVGYSYQKSRSERLEKTNAKSIPTCHRLTGGGKVEHGNDLIFSLIASKKHDDSFSSVRVSYLKIHEAIKTALEELGQAPRFYRCDEQLPKGDDCFRYPIATDLALNEKKIAGGAQKRSSGAFLHQESLSWPGIHENRTVMEAMGRGFETVFQIKIQSKDWEPGLFQAAEELAQERYPVFA